MERQDKTKPPLVRVPKNGHYKIIYLFLNIDIN
jgi:hypothetical protein